MFYLILQYATTNDKKLFIASSVELKADRLEFRIFISVENDWLYKLGVYFEVLKCEYFRVCHFRYEAAE